MSEPYHSPVEPDAFLATVQRLLSTQPLGVLSTLKDGHPYLSLVGFVASDDSRNLYFATLRATRKHENMRRSPKVALLIDSRTNQAGDFLDAMALTAYGTAREIEGQERAQIETRYVAKFPHLEDFVTSPTCALVRVGVSRYSLVRRFQDVLELDLT